MKQKDFPNKLYKWTFYALLIVVGITFFVLVTGDSQTQQNGFGIMLLEFFCAIVVVFILSIVTTIVYKEWFKEYWWVNMILFLFSGTVIVLAIIASANGGIG